MVNIFYFIYIYGKYIFWLEIGQKWVSGDKTTSFYGCKYFLKFCISKRRRFALRGFKTASFWISCHILKTTSFLFLIHLNDVVLILHFKKKINNETTSFCLLQRRNDVVSATLKCLKEELVPRFQISICFCTEWGRGRGRVGGWISPGTGEQRRQSATTARD